METQKGHPAPQQCHTATQDWVVPTQAAGAAVPTRTEPQMGRR